jgi:hypothetical protein
MLTQPYRCSAEQWQIDNNDYWVSDVTSWFFPNHALPKRHLVSTYTSPSAYLHPPMDTCIPFTFPLSSRQNEPPPLNASMPRLRRVQSAPMKTLAASTTSPNTIASIHATNPIANLGFSRIQTLCSKGSLYETMDTPFLRVRQYIRVILHITTDGKSYPICIGLPFAITKAVKVQPDETSEGLPTYQSLARDAERLPDYTIIAAADNDEDGAGSGPDQTARDRSSRRRRRRNGPPDIDELACEIGNLAVGRQRSKSKSNQFVAAERRMDDFLVLVS